MNAHNSNHDRLTIGQRIGEFAAAVGMVVLFGFFVYHQQVNSGFFTDRFGGLEMLCLYVPIVAGLFAPAVRAWTGQRNPARPFEITANLLMAIGAVVLLSVFPFDFAHLADTLPSALHFVLAWVPEWLGKLALIVQIVGGFLAAAVAAWKYFSYRRRTFASSY